MAGRLGERRPAVAGRNEAQIDVSRDEERLVSIIESWRCAPLELRLLNRPPRTVGEGKPLFRVTVNSPSGLAAVLSLDELRIGQAYMSGDLEFDGDMLALLGFRKNLSDRKILRFIWTAWLQPAVLGRIRGDRKSIAKHYDLESDFFFKFIEQKTHCYSHGYFENEAESLEDAVQRKLNTAIEACRIQPGSRVLDIGAGWGTFVQHAGALGVRVTSLTISNESQRYVDALIHRENLPCQVLLEHFLEHRSDEPYDAIVNLGVTEHLPDYPATLQQYERLLKPGGRVFLDACGGFRKHTMSTWTRRYIWTGTGRFLHLSRYVKAVERSGLELVMVRNDRKSYMLTMKHWAENLERNKDEICERWGEDLYRRFRIYLWGGAQLLDAGKITAYRMLLELPAEGKPHRWTS